MPADERIKVIFRDVLVRNDGDWFGSGEWYFRATVGDRTLSEGDRRWNVRDGDAVRLVEERWHAIVDTAGTDQVRITFRAFDEDPTGDEELASMSHVLRRPFAQSDVRMIRTRLRNCEICWEVQLGIGGRFGRHPPGAVFCTRRNAGQGLTNCSTASGGRANARIEVCPVWPVPPDAVMPRRPAVPTGVGVYRNEVAKLVVAGSDPNTIPNPAVIPLLSAPAPATGAAPALRANDPPRADLRNSARIEVTKYWPISLAFGDDDPRLEWEADPRSRADFVGGNTGLKVMVRGIAEGDVVFRVKYLGAVAAEYRAIVRRICRVPYRVNILNGPGRGKPRTMPAHAANHVAIANVFLRQAGIELVPDANETRTDRARETEHPAIFRISVLSGRTRNVGGSHPRPCPLNYRDGVVNIQYIHSIQHRPNMLIFGWAADRPSNPLHPSMSDEQVPTPSWLCPTDAGGGGGCGVPPSAAPGGSILIDLLEPSDRPGFNAAGRPTLAAMLITNDNGDPASDAGARMYGNVIAHELGHILGLRHRVGAGPDNARQFPPAQNMMCQGEPPLARQDFDRVQARAMLMSPLVPV